MAIVVASTLFYSVAATVAVNAAIYVAGKELMSSLTPDFPESTGVDPSSDQTLSTQTAAPRNIVYGETIVGGQIIGYQKTKSGRDEEFHNFVIHIAGHVCDSVELYEIEGKTADEAAGKFTIQVFDGTQTTVPINVKNNINGWTYDHVGFGQTYAYVQTSVDADFFQNGVNSIKFKVRGKKIYDPRLDTSVGGTGLHRFDDASTWQYSNNPELIAVDYQRFYGAKKQPARRFDFDFIAIAANYCDELTTYTDINGVQQSEKRFTCNGVLNNAMSPPDGLKEILKTFGGRHFRVGSKTYFKPAMYTGPADITLNAEDSVVLPVITPHVSESQRCNVVRARFVDPELGYQETDATPIYSDDYDPLDGEHLEEDLSLLMVYGNTQAQRLERYHLDAMRAGFAVQYEAKGMRLDLTAGRYVKFVDDEMGVDIECSISEVTYNNSKNATALTLKNDFVELYGENFNAAQPELNPVSSFPKFIDDAITNFQATDIYDGVIQSKLTWSNPYYSTQLKIDWQRNENSQQVTTTIIGLVTRENTYFLQALKPGLYLVSLRAVDREGNTGNWLSGNQVITRSNTGYTWRIYADDTSGTNASKTDETLPYVGIAFNQAVAEPSLATLPDPYTFFKGASAAGEAGKSAYELWLEQGNTGTLTDFLASLNGYDGAGAFTLLNTNNCALTPTSITKTGGGNNWNAGAYSKEVYARCSTSFRFKTNSRCMFGLSDAAISNANFAQISYAIYANGSDFHVYLSGTNLGVFGTYDSDDVFTIENDGDEVNFFKNATLVYNHDNAPANTINRLDASLYSEASEVLDISFVPLAQKGQDGANGQDGTDGSNALNIGWATGRLEKWYQGIHSSSTLSTAAWSVATPTDLPTLTSCLQLNSSIHRDFYSETVPLESTRRYRISGWFKQTGTTAKHYLTVVFLNAAGEVLNFSPGFSHGTYDYHSRVNQSFPETWTRYSFEFGGTATAQAPAGAVSCRIGALLCYASSGNTDVIQINNYRIEEIPQDGVDGTNGANGVNGNNGSSIVFHGSFSDYPSTNENGYSFYHAVNKRSYVRQDGAWYQMTIDGTNGTNGTNGQNGISISYRGEFSTPPSSPQLNWVYRDSDNGYIYIFDGSAWLLMVADGEAGANGLDVYVTYSLNAIDNKPPIPADGDGNLGDWSTQEGPAVNWMSQKVASSATAGTWGEAIQIAGRDGAEGPPGADGTPGADAPGASTVVADGTVRVYNESETDIYVITIPAGNLWDIELDVTGSQTYSYLDNSNPYEPETYPRSSRVTLRLYEEADGSVAPFPVVSTLVDPSSGYDTENSFALQFLANAKTGGRKYRLTAEPDVPSAFTTGVTSVSGFLRAIKQ